MNSHFELDDATLRLFKGVVVEPNSSDLDSNVSHNESDAAKLLKQGVVVENRILKVAPDRFFDIAYTASNLYGANKLKLNSSFYKTIESVKNLSFMQRIIDQQTHYQSTYGSPDGSSIYEPEQLSATAFEDINDDNDDVALVIIKALTKFEVADRIKEMLISGTALKSQTIKDIQIIIDKLELTIDYIDEIKNREAMCLLCDKLGLVPENFDEFTRFLVYKVTGSTLLVKNKALYNQIDLSLKRGGLDKYIKSYVQHFGKLKMAQNITRYRKLYLIIKHHSYPNAKTIFNQVFRMSKKEYIPRKQSVLDNFYNPYNDNERVLRAAENATPAKLVQIRNIGLEEKGYLQSGNHYRNRLFRIRNGKSYLKQDKPFFSYFAPNLNRYFTTYFIDHRLDAISRILRNKLNRPAENALFYIPKGVNYVVPTSEKNFIGSMPQFSSYHVENDKRVLIGISWDTQCDLDLHANTLDGCHIGWNSSYNNGGITYSGDMTSLNEYGYAAEYMAIDPRRIKKPLIIGVNYFGSPDWYKGESDEVKFDIFATTEPVDTHKKNTIINQIGDKSLLVHDKLSIDSRSKTLMYVKPDEDETGVTIYFINQNYGNVRVPSGSNKQEVLMEVLDRKISSQMSLGGLIDELGGQVTRDKEEFEKCTSKTKPRVIKSKAIGDMYSLETTVHMKGVDLSPQNVTSDQMLAFLKVKDKGQSIDGIQ